MTPLEDVCTGLYDSYNINMAGEVVALVQNLVYAESGV
jgi:hypothetical protein